MLARQVVLNCGAFHGWVGCAPCFAQLAAGSTGQRGAPVM